MTGGCPKSDKCGDEMKATFVVASTLVLFLWYYVLYTILVAIHPDRLIWFLFWVYIPLGVLVKILDELVEKEKKK